MSNGTPRRGPDDVALGPTRRALVRSAALHLYRRAMSRLPPYGERRAWTLAHPVRASLLLAAPLGLLAALWLHQVITWPAAIAVAVVAAGTGAAAGVVTMKRGWGERSDLETPPPPSVRRPFAQISVTFLRVFLALLAIGLASDLAGGALRVTQLVWVGVRLLLMGLLAAELLRRRRGPAQGPS